MKFTKNGKLVESNDPIHIDCFIAKGWVKVVEEEVVKAKNIKQTKVDVEEVKEEIE